MNYLPSLRLLAHHTKLAVRPARRACTCDYTDLFVCGAAKVEVSVVAQELLDPHDDFANVLDPADDAPGLTAPCVVAQEALSSVLGPSPDPGDEFSRSSKEVRGRHRFATPGWPVIVPSHRPIKDVTRMLVDRVA